jgi:hypothetical protein
MSREGGRAAPRRVPLLAVALVLLALMLLGCLASGWITHAAVGHARETCDAITPGTPLVDARRVLAERDGATTMGTSTSTGPRGTARSEQIGVLGHVVGWTCQLDLDARGTVSRSIFSSWMVNDFHGRWDDGINQWLERHWL